MKLIPAGNLTSADPVMPIRWCLERSETETLKHYNAKDVHILFVIAYEGNTIEDRQLVPIGQVMEYLKFRRPGKHVVFAKVIWPSRGIHRDALKRIFSRENPLEYTNKVLNDERTGFRSHLESRYSISVLQDDAKIEVVIPPEHFPKEPPKWFKWLVNLGYEYPAVDQCQFRGRAPFVIVKIPAMLIWAVVTTLIRIASVLLCGLCGMRNIGFRPIFHPWKNDILDVYVPTTNSWFFHDDKGEKRPHRLLLLHPML